MANNIDFNELETKNNISQRNSFYIMMFKDVNNRKISFKIPLNSFEKFYLNVNLFNEMKKTMDDYRTEITSLMSKIGNKEYVELNFLEKKDATYQKNKLLTEPRMNDLLNDYCNARRIEIDIEACNADARAKATSIGNYLGIIASISKTANAENTYRTFAADSIATSIDNIEIPGPEG